ncbi:putative Transcription factor IIB C-terminal module 1 [Leishmania utingensis]|uniref:Transcription factor IIB C-terminal module 1 n=1 Tax=Leishmania utingensis TaxID=653362 RepID=A0AAW3ATR2_9TRYP
MATAADYVGKNCPYCGAVDSIETDEARGEAACVNCATVVAMGLEESVATRFEKDATHADVDRGGDADWDVENGGAIGRATAKNAGLTREEAAACAAGLLRCPMTAVQGTNAGPFGDTAKYAKTKLHPRMSAQLEVFFRLSRRYDEAILRDAIALAKHFVGFRRERGVRVEHQTEVAAASLMLASERLGQPIPLSEMRVLDGTLKDIESRRLEIIDATNLREEMAQMAKKYVPNLIHYYVQLLQLPLINYEMPCLALFHAIRQCENKSDPGASELAVFVEAEKVIMAVLLARTEPRLQWPNKPLPPTDPSAEPSRATLYSSFASNAHLQPVRVEKLMRVAERAVPLIQPEFNRLMQMPEFTTAAVRAVGEAVVNAFVKTEEYKSTAPVKSESMPASAPSAPNSAGAGRKRNRSCSPTPPAPLSPALQDG